MPPRRPSRCRSLQPLSSEPGRPSMQPEVGNFLHDFCRTLGNHTPALDDVGVVSYRQSEFRILLDQENRNLEPLHDCVQRLEDPTDDLGATPTLGSSTRSIDGAINSALATASICCSPPESCWPRRRRRSCKLGKRSKWLPSPGPCQPCPTSLGSVPRVVPFPGLRLPSFP